jgi:hypothetical protein
MQYSIFSFWRYSWPWWLKATFTVGESFIYVVKSKANQFREKLRNGGFFCQGPDKKKLNME